MNDGNKEGFDKSISTEDHCREVAAVARSTKATHARRGRKPAKYDNKVRLERSQQSARECRARKKLRYQYLEELVTSREKAIVVLRKELDAYKKHCKDIDEGNITKQIEELVKKESASQQTPPDDKTF